MTDTLDNPLAPTLLPARSAPVTISTDVPTEVSTRPFGLTRVAILRDGEAMVSLEGAVYDPARRLSVDRSGTPFVRTPGVIHAGTSYDTQYDMTWVVDKD